nr:hypothetical protein [Stenotrophomonas pavanii]
MQQPEKNAFTNVPAALLPSWQFFIDAYSTAVRSWDESEGVGEDEVAMFNASDESLRDWMDDMQHRIGIDVRLAKIALEQYIESRVPGCRPHAVESASAVVDPALNDTAKLTSIACNNIAGF